MGAKKSLIRGAAYLTPVGWIALLVILYDSLSPWLRLAGATVGLLYSIKIGSWVLLSLRDDGTVSMSSAQTLVYWTVWPSVRPDHFAEGDNYPEPRNFVRGYVFGVFGLLLGLFTVLVTPYVGYGVGSWLMIFALLSTIHFGLGTVMPFALRWVGVPAPSLFNRPLRSQGVGEFWSSRWNLPFVEMNRLFITEPLSERMGVGTAAFLAFLVSGVLHEMAISYPAGAGWGLPLVYFLIQAASYAAEEKFFPEDGEGWSVPRSLWTWTVVLVPLLLLFHGPFRQAFVVPVIELFRYLLVQYSAADYLGAGLWIGAIGQFLVLVASYQVPEELEWREDLQSLKPLNRKLMWTYGGFIVLMIVSFGVLTAVFHGEFVSGNPVALGLSVLIAVFWTTRVLVDTFYFSHDDWPDGVKYVVGHVMLTSLFLLLVAVYSGVVIYHTV